MTAGWMFIRPQAGRAEGGLQVGDGRDKGGAAASMAAGTGEGLHPAPAVLILDQHPTTLGRAASPPPPAPHGAGGKGGARSPRTPTNGR
jgi:hypothetical protein